VVRLRDKNKLKVDLLNILIANKGHVLGIEEIKASLFIEKNEHQAFEQALKELEKEGKVQKYVGLP
jgi:hypothetical protein